ncbi:hypothetical protein LXA43DRAFT_1104919 [Ganoderma leucocontextum]|nr:hypothetical protein LXA43DRAFT_1104919 [Ganoderma leucocontextum]
MSLCTKLPQFDITPYNSTVTFDWRHVPDSINNFYDWATITDPGEAAIPGEKCIVYTPTVADHAWPSDNSELYEVAILVHGFVSAINLSPFGNWTRREQHAPAAIRSITLDTSDHDIPLTCQRHSLHVLELFADMTEGAVPFTAINDNTQNAAIRVQQNIFMKLCPSDDTTPSSILTDHVDRGRHARRIAHRWRVQLPPPTFVRRPSGSELAIQSQAIRVGDFVELTINPNIRPIHCDAVLRPTLFLNIGKVVKLWAPPQQLHPPASAPQHIHPIPAPAAPVADDLLPPDDLPFPVDDNILPFPPDDDAILPDI